jgi:UDP-MurNAc hydroxylase
MKIRYIKSSTVLVESKGVKILTDPWLIDGEYYGAWYHYPELYFDRLLLDEVDYIYVSHIHPDHFSKKTFEKLKKSIPVLIHRYESKFLKTNIERLGFSVIELGHNERNILKNGVSITILAADNCNPELCGRFFGCGIVEAKYGSTQIDTVSVITDGEFVVVNTNDCPFELTRGTLQVIKKEYPKIDLLLVGYGGAGPYPQCFKLDDMTKKNASDKKRVQFLDYGVNYINELKPENALPFAGTYVLGGKLAKLQDDRGVPEIEDAAAYFREHTQSKIVLLNSYEYIDLKTGNCSKPYKETDLEAKRAYIENVLSKKKLDYCQEGENEETYFKAHSTEILTLLESAYNRFERKRKEINFISDTSTLLYINNNFWCKISNNGLGFEFVDELEKSKLSRFVSYKLDIRLLHQILLGPRYAHWNNAEIGSHIEFERVPNIFERGLHHSMNFFHS